MEQHQPDPAYRMWSGHWCDPGTGRAAGNRYCHSGDVFVGALKAIAPLLVFFLLISALCHAGKSHGGIIKTVIIMYMFSTFLAALVAVIASRLFPVTLTGRR